MIFLLLANSVARAETSGASMDVPPSSEEEGSISIRPLSSKVGGADRCDIRHVPISQETSDGAHYLDRLFNVPLDLENPDEIVAKVAEYSRGTMALDMIYGVPYARPLDTPPTYMDVPVSVELENASVWDAIKAILHDACANEKRYGKLMPPVVVGGLTRKVPPVLFEPAFDISIRNVPARDALCAVASQSPVQIGFHFHLFYWGVLHYAVPHYALFIRLFDASGEPMAFNEPWQKGQGQKWGEERSSAVCGEVTHWCKPEDKGEMVPIMREIVDDGYRLLSSELSKTYAIARSEVPEFAKRERGVPIKVVEGIPWVCATGDAKSDLDIPLSFELKNASTWEALTTTLHYLRCAVGLDWEVEPLRARNQGCKREPEAFFEKSLDFCFTEVPARIILTEIVSTSPVYLQVTYWRMRTPSPLVRVELGFFAGETYLPEIAETYAMEESASIAEERRTIMEASCPPDDGNGPETK